MIIGSPKPIEAPGGVSAPSANDDSLNSAYGRPTSNMTTPAMSSNFSAPYDGSYPATSSYAPVSVPHTTSSYPPYGLPSSSVSSTSAPIGSNYGMKSEPSSMGKPSYEAQSSYSFVSLSS